MRGIQIVLLSSKINAKYHKTSVFVLVSIDRALRSDFSFNAREYADASFEHT